MGFCRASGGLSSPDNCCGCSKGYLIFAENSPGRSLALIYSGTHTLTYDGRGNLLGDGTWSFTYDIDNRMKTAGNGTVSLSYAYDAAGRLARRTKGTASETYLYDGVDMVGEYDGAGALLRRTIHGPGIDEPLVIYTGPGTATKTWLYADHQGSVTATANSSGAPVATLSYGPYGEPNTLSGPAFRYTGQRLDPDSGLYYYKARWYSPYLGRFLQTDPIGQADDLNLYAYVKNDPINLTDPSGLAPGDIYRTSDEAARAAHNDVIDRSIKESIEYVTIIYQLSLGTGKFSYTNFRKGTATESEVPPVPLFGKGIGIYHTHGAYKPRYTNEEFSPDDIKLLEEEGAVSYLGTTSGRLLKYTPKPGKTNAGRIDLLEGKRVRTVANQPEYQTIGNLKANSQSEEKMILNTAIATLGLLLSASFAMAGTYTADYGKTNNYIPTEGYVPDAKTAATIADAVLVPVYGEKQIEKQKPFLIRRSGNKWIIKGQLKPSRPGVKIVGGTAYVEIDANTGEILHMTHGR